MPTLTTASLQFLLPPISYTHLKFTVFPSIILPINPKIRPQRCYFNSVMPKNLRFLEKIKRGCRCNGWDTDADPALEADIFEFMKSSSKPEVFPSKQELLDAGRKDLVDAIREKGGWLSAGWESDDDVIVKDVVKEIDVDYPDFGEYITRVADIQERDSEIRVSDFNSGSVNSSQSGLPSDRPLALSCEEDNGIEGILNGLEKERNLTFGISLGGNVNGSLSCCKDDEDDTYFESLDANDSEIEICSKGVFNSSSRKTYDDHSGAKLSDFSNGSIKPDTWRAWSNQRAGFSDEEFEAAEICFGENGMNASSVAEQLGKQVKVNHWEIKTRLKQLENEISATLRILRSNKDEFITKTQEYQGNQDRSDEIHKLSDTLEFQENEVINSQGRLRSIRAKLAVLEGKMALATIEAQKIDEEKQRRSNNARTALQRLRNVTIVWPNSASQVLLVGSFDGWTSQRKMEKSRVGVFSLTMKLYPGRYEMKFIVDGEWKVDPLREIVRNNGYENNLFIVT